MVVINKLMTKHYLISNAKDNRKEVKTSYIIRLFKYLFSLKNSRFVQNITIIAGGTAIAQLITIAFSWWNGKFNHEHI